MRLTESRSRADSKKLYLSEKGVPTTVTTDTHTSSTGTRRTLVLDDDPLSPVRTITGDARTGLRSGSKEIILSEVIHPESVKESTFKRVRRSFRWWSSYPRPRWSVVLRGSRDSPLTVGSTFRLRGVEGTVGGEDPTRLTHVPTPH